MSALAGEDVGWAAFMCLSFTLLRVWSLFSVVLEILFSLLIYTKTLVVWVELGEWGKAPIRASSEMTHLPKRDLF